MRVTEPLTDHTQTFDQPQKRSRIGNIAMGLLGIRELLSQHSEHWWHVVLGDVVGHIQRHN